jgi:hypothetical protein
MTNIFLLWRRRPGYDPDPDEVAARLQATFAPLFEVPPKARVRRTQATAMVHLELIPRGWNAPLFDEDADGWALAPDYPVNARSAAGLTESGPPPAGTLLAVCRKLQANPVPLLEEMAPPFSVIWSDTRSGETWVQNDGLGQAQLFEFERGNVWAVTNRAFALRALGVELEPVPEEWAARMTLGWFPLTLTGYRGLRFFAPGTQLCVGRERLTRNQFDVIADWVRPDPLTRGECLELARTSLIRQIRDAQPLWDRATLLFSGGRDSRVIAASLRAAGVDFLARVGGVPGNPDVIIAERLACAGGLTIEPGQGAHFPPPDPAETRRRISLALLWEAGYRLTGKHEVFLPHGEYLGRGGVKVTGKHGEIGRAFYAKKFGTETEARRQEARFVDRMMDSMPSFTRRRWKSRVRGLIEEAYFAADRYGLTDLARQDFFYLHERTRRLASGSHCAKAGFVFGPFMNPDYIRASFAWPGSGYEKTRSPFHDHIVATNVPEWAEIPYTSDLEAAAAAEVGAVQAGDNGADWRRLTEGKDYDSMLYWQTVGRRLIEEALDQGGFWTELFDPDAARKEWEDAPQKFAIAHLLDDVVKGRAFAAGGE